MLSRRTLVPLERLPDRPTRRRRAGEPEPADTSRLDRASRGASLGRAVLLATVVGVIGAVSLAEDLAPTRPLVDLGAQAQGWAASGIAEAELAWRGHLEAAEVVHELADLEREHARLQLELGRLRHLEREHLALLEVLDMAERGGVSDGVAARLVALGGGPRQVVRLDVGQDAGVQVGHIAVGATGVLGQVVEAGRSYADVLALTDPSAGAHAVLADSGARGVVEGTGEGLRMSRVALRADEVRLGEWVYTSGLGEVFPAGLPLGEVTAVHGDPEGPFLQLELSPLGRVDRSEVVWLVQADGPDVVASR